MVRSLNQKWKEFLFAFSGFGPNFLMILMGAFYSDALNPAALENGEQFQAISEGVCFVLPMLFPILYAIGKIFDGIIDVPFAHITDTLSTKWGRRRPAIAVCFLPMVVSFVLSWIPIGGAENPLLNTIWVAVWNLVFFATYTMCLIAFYGSLSTVCTDEPQRLRVSGYKSFFDTITYCLVYALVPVILSGFELQIDRLVFVCTPLMLTMLIPLFLIKEGEKYGYPENRGAVSQKISMAESIRLTFRNRPFRAWLLVNACTFFGLQMFLSAMNGMMIGGMGMNGAQMALLNTFAFAPVPIMLYLFNKLKAKWGVRRVYQSCLLVFAISIMSFFLASRYVLGEQNTMIKIALGVMGGLMASWSIGAFFMVPYLAPAQISSVEERLTGKNHSAMYYAGNALVTSIVGAISGSLIYEYIKNLFIAKDVSKVAFATSSAEAAEQLLADATRTDAVYNLGNLLVPFIVCLACVIGFFLAFKLPRDFTPTLLAKEFKRDDPSLDISGIENEEVAPEKGEIIFVQVGLSVLSGFIFGFIWTALLVRSIKVLTAKLKCLPTYLISCLVPFASIFFVLRMRARLVEAANEKGIELKLNRVVLVAFCLVFPILPVNAVALAMLQHAVNCLYEAE